MHCGHGQNLFVESSGFTHDHENGNGIVHTRITVNDEAAGWRSGAGGTRRHVCAREGAERSEARPSERLGREVPQRRQRFCLCAVVCVVCVGYRRDGEGGQVSCLIEGSGGRNCGGLDLAEYGLHGRRWLCLGRWRGFVEDACQVFLVGI